MEPFSHLLSLLGTVRDPRRAQGKMYSLPHLLLFAILAMIAGASSDRALHSFMDVQLERLRQTFNLRWRRAPAYTSVRLILQAIVPDDLERVFRCHAELLAEPAKTDGVRVVAFDGKTLRGSFDHFEDRAAMPLVSAVEVTSGLTLGHMEVGAKDSEIPAVQVLLTELGLVDRVVTADALHGQKNL
jgi:hypothetical protein